MIATFLMKKEFLENHNITETQVYACQTTQCAQMDSDLQYF